MKLHRLLSILTRAFFLLAILLTVTVPTCFLVFGWLVRTDPLLAVDHLSALNSFDPLYPALISLGVLIATCFLPRFFCRWFCPFGLILDICRMGSGWLKKCHFPVFHLHRSYKILGRLLLLLMIIAPFAGGMSLFLFDPTVLTFILVDYQHASMLLVAMALLPVIGTLFIPNLWCGIFCPCGTLSDMVYRFAQILLKVTGYKKEKKNNQEEIPSTVRKRRTFLRDGIFAGLGLAVVGGMMLILHKTVHFALNPLRPAGSVREPKFSQLCTRCGACRRVCPMKVLVPLEEKNGSFQTPVLDFEAGYCKRDCHRCADVCPTGAIIPLSSEKKQRTPSVEIQINLEGCRLWNDRECAACKNECPTEAIAFVWDEEEYMSIPKIEKKLCDGCGRCVHYCPGFEDQKGLVAVAVTDLE